MINELPAVDPFDLHRFVEAQQEIFDQVMSELIAGRKRSHWMWFIFPQIDGLASSVTSKRYAIKNLDEARAYLDHPILGPRLDACAKAVLDIDGRSALEIFGSPDDLKLKSCSTLFADVLPVGSVFHRILDKYYHGARDDRTLNLIRPD